MTYKGNSLFVGSHTHTHTHTNKSTLYQLPVYICMIWVMKTLCYSRYMVIVISTFSLPKVQIYILLPDTIYWLVLRVCLHHMLWSECVLSDVYKTLPMHIINSMLFSSVFCGQHWFITFIWLGEMTRVIHVKLYQTQWLLSLDFYAFQTS
jgi:hypothetical protein